MNRPIRLLTALALFSALTAFRVEGQDLQGEPIVGHRELLEARAIAMKAARPALQGFTPMSAAERRQAVDTYWGEGPTTAEKLRIFDQFWTYTDEKYAAFQGIEVRWHALRNRYRPEIEKGVSRGRFVAIMNHLSLALVESHSQPLDWTVNVFTVPAPGVPLLAVGTWQADPSGVCTTAQDDGSSLVYSAIPQHPLGLEPGDRIVGYDGEPWRKLYKQLVAEELPLYPLWWGSSPSSFEHSFVMAAAANWHLFGTMDIRKANGALVHVPTSLMPEPIWHGVCSEQMDIPGVPKPAAIFTDPVSFGIVEGTNIGYIYVWSWADDTKGTKFERAVIALTQERKVDALIIDFRFNEGGYLEASRRGIGALLRTTVTTVGFSIRKNPDDHFKMKVLWGPRDFKLNVDDNGRINESYPGPVAVLVGPGALSGGDFSSLWMTELRHARVFGKSTAAAFNLPTQRALGTGPEMGLHPDWFSRIAEANAFEVGSRHDFLTHREFPVDEPVWLKPSDVAANRDTVVEAALAWIRRAQR